MSESANGFGETLRRALQANLEYYKGLIQLTTDYVKVLGTVVQDEANRASGDRRAEQMRAVRVQQDPPGGSSQPREPEPGRSATARSAEPRLVLEGAPGTVARTAFRVTNTLAQEVTAVIKAAPVVDAQGAPVDIAMAATPGVLTLAPGQGQTVMLSAQIPTSMAQDATYHTRIEVPDLAAEGVNLLIRRSAGTSAATTTKAKAKATVKRTASKANGAKAGTKKKTASAAKVSSTRKRPTKAPK